MTPDQYRREGAEAMRAYIANHCDPAHLPRSENPTEFYAGYRHAAIEKFTAIRAIDVDEVLAGMPPVPDATARLVEAARAMRGAICGPDGFAECVRRDSGRAYPWEALEIAERLMDAALAAMGADHD